MYDDVNRHNGFSPERIIGITVSLLNAWTIMDGGLAERAGTGGRLHIPIGI